MPQDEEAYLRDYVSNDAKKFAEELKEKKSVLEDKSRIK